MGKHHAGLTEVRLSIPHDVSFEDIVSMLESALTLPAIGRFAGCAPCGTLVQRIVLEDPAFRELNQLRVQGELEQLGELG